MIDLSVETRQREEWIDVTEQVRRAVDEIGLKNGVCLVYIPHTTAGVTLQENADPSVISDALMALDRAVPADLPYRHAEGNSTAHVKSTMTGVSALIPVRDGRLALGTWQGIYFCEYDGPRNRRMTVGGMPTE